MEQTLLESNQKFQREFEVKSEDLPASQKMLYEVREELKSDFNALSLKFDALALRVDHNQKHMEIQIERVLNILSSHIHSMKLLIEEQNNKNNFVLDKYGFVSDKQEKSEQRIAALEKSVFGIESK